MENSIECAQASDIVQQDDEPPLLRKCAPDSSAASSIRQSASPTLRAMARSPQWSDWHWQLRNRIRSLAKLAELFPRLDISRDALKAAEKFPQAVTPYYASLAQTSDISDPVLRMSVPQHDELFNPPFLKDDPLAEESHMPIPGLVHRYPDRALFLVTSACPVYCRHCTRKRVTGERESKISAARLQHTVEYLTAHPEIKDVVVSGGDPLTMSDSAIEAIIEALRSVPSVEIIRIGTRTPVTLPFRITDELVARLRKYHPIWINTHFNHPCEITPESTEACRRLADAGFPLGNQSVLLKGVNDDATVMETLLRGLVRIRVRPYYLFQCDLVAGVEHFRTPLSKGIEIMNHLRGRLSGIAIPTFVVDLPDGCGKVPVLPEYVVSKSPTETVFRNGAGVRAGYPEPVVRDAAATGRRNVEYSKSAKGGRKSRRQRACTAC
ncbi:MAG: KamA family radical SAM protein [bacterium]